MPDETAKPPEGRIKQAATLIASVAALITSCAALVQACDKSVEKKSYETLAEKIVELQQVVPATPAPASSNEQLVGAALPAPAPSASAVRPVGRLAGGGRSISMPLSSAEAPVPMPDPPTPPPVLPEPVAAAPSALPPIMNRMERTSRFALPKPASAAPPVWDKLMTDL